MGFLPRMDSKFATADTDTTNPEIVPFPMILNDTACFLMILNYTTYFPTIPNDTACFPMILYDTSSIVDTSSIILPCFLKDT